MGIRIVASMREYCIAAWLTLSCSVHAQDIATELNQIYDDAPTEMPADRLPTHGFLGAAMVTTEQALGDKRGFIAPLVAVTYGDTFYWQIARGGVWLFKSNDRSTRAGLVVKPRRGYEPDDHDGLLGMDERDTSIEVGVNGVWTRPVIVNAAYYTDISNKSDGNSFNLGLSRPIRVGHQWSITPNLGAEWLSANVVDYYYGVKPSEVATMRPAYQGKSSINLRMGVTVHYGLTHHWLLFSGVGYTQLGSGITASPLVIHDRITTLHLGGGRRF